MLAETQFTTMWKSARSEFPKVSKFAQKLTSPVEHENAYGVARQSRDPAMASIPTTAYA